MREMTHKSRFFDGKTADQHDLDIVIYKEKIIGKTSSKKTFLEWRINDICVVKEPENGCSAVIASQSDNDARLYIEESTFQELEPLLNKKQMPVLGFSTSVKSTCIWMVIASLFVIIVFQSIPRLAPYIAQKLPQKWERSLGDFAFNSLAGKEKICNSVDGLNSLEKMLSALNLKDNDDLKTIVVVENEDINAFATPGGKIVLFSGLIQKSGSPTEVAGVIAHEMGHIINKHPTEALVRSLGLTLITKLMLGNAGNMGNVGQTLFDLKYRRNDERKADKTALRILEKNDIDPRGFRDFFERVQAKELSSDWNILSYFSTHPKTSERIDDIPDNEKSKEYKLIITEDEWKALRRICDEKNLALILTDSKRSLD